MYREPFIFILFQKLITLLCCYEELKKTFKKFEILKQANNCFLINQLKIPTFTRFCLDLI